MSKGIAIIGAGFYGSYLALRLSSLGVKVTIFEKNNDIFLGAATNNQQRLHLGFHYPRCKETASQSIRAFNDFMLNFGDCVDDIEKNIYSIDEDSRVSFEDYLTFCNDLSLQFQIADKNDYSIFFKKKQSGAILVNEKKINLNKIRQKFNLSIARSNISVKFGEYVHKEKYLNLMDNYEYVINCSYNEINLFDNIDAKYEVCIIPLIKFKKNSVFFDRNKAVTIMDGEFFSMYPSDSIGTYTLSSVKYTPILKTNSSIEACNFIKNIKKDDILDRCDLIFDKGNEYLKISEGSIVGHYKSIKAKPKFDQITDSRLSFVKKNNNSITVFAGKISCVFDIEKAIIDIIS